MRADITSGVKFLFADIFWISRSIPPASLSNSMAANTAFDKIKSVTFVAMPRWKMRGISSCDFGMTKFVAVSTA